MSELEQNAAQPFPNPVALVVLEAIAQTGEATAEQIDDARQMLELVLRQFGSECDPVSQLLFSLALADLLSEQWREYLPAVNARAIEAIMAYGREGAPALRYLLAQAHKAGAPVFVAATRQLYALVIQLIGTTTSAQDFAIAAAHAVRSLADLIHTPPLTPWFRWVPDETLPLQTRIL